MYNLIHPDFKNWLTTNRYADADKAKEAPPSACIYCIYSLHLSYNNNYANLEYIGCSRNLYNRLNSHPKINDLVNSGAVYQVFFMPTDVEDLLKTERILIKKHQPRLNMQHTAKEYRSKFIRI